MTFPDDYSLSRYGENRFIPDRNAPVEENDDDTISANTLSEVTDRLEPSKGTEKTSEA